MPTEENTYRQGIMDRFDNLDKNIAKLDAKVSYTNGKVADLIKWKYYLTGFCACIGVLILPLLWSLIQSGRL